MKLSTKIWKELGALAQHVEILDHDNGTAKYKAAATPADIAAVDAVLVAHDPNALDPDDTAEEAKAKLLEIDISSIRALREYISAQPDAPQIVKDQEIKASNARSKISKGAQL